MKSKILRTFLILAIISPFTFSHRAFSAVVNVTCAGTTADTATLNTAISGSSVGDQISIHKTCLINGTIVLEGDRSYIGDSRTGTIIEQANNTNLTAMLASDSWNSNTSTTGDPIRIEHLTLNGNSGGGNTSGTNALVIRSWQTVVDDLLVENASGDGIQVTNTSKNGTALTNSQVNSRISDVFITSVGGNGVNVVDSGNSVTDSDIIDSWIADTGLSGINLANAAGWKIRGDHIYGIQNNAIYASRCFGTAIDGNYIEDFGDAGGSATWYGIACTAQGDIGSVITGNKVFQFHAESGSSSYVYIGVPQVNYGIGIVNVVNNVIVGASGTHDTGLSYQLTGGGSGLDVLSSNNVQDVSTVRSVGAGVTVVSGQ